MSNIQKFFKSDAVLKRFSEVLGQNASGFVTSIISLVNENAMLSQCEPQTIAGAAMKAAALKLPIDPNLGFAYVIPYRNNKKNSTDAQFQLGYKGFIQLAMRSGQMKRINAIPIYEGQLIESNPLTENYEFDFSVKSDKIIGYAAYMELINGFRKTVFWTIEKVKTHAARYSQSYKKSYSPWKDLFDEMAIKTVIKSMLSKYAPLSADIQSAITFDQSTGADIDENIYDDNDFSDVQDVEELPKLDKKHPNWLKIVESLKSKEVGIDDIESMYIIDEKTLKTLKKDAGLQ
jgi:recombination protein RecT